MPNQIFILSFFFISQVWSNDLLKSGYHHLEPDIQEMVDVMKVKQEADHTCSENNNDDIFRYISDKPKTEPWRDYYKLPKPITEKLYKVKDVCEEAKKMNAAQGGVAKKYALVLNKGHICDVGHRACLTALKTISDKCNYFIQDNFQTFHSFGYIYKRNTAPGTRQIQDTYGMLEPSLIVIRLSDCKPVPTLESIEKKDDGLTTAKKLSDGQFRNSIGEGKDPDNEYNFKSKNDINRFSSMKKSLFENSPELGSSLANSRDNCFDKKTNERSLPGLSDDDKVHYGDITVSGIVAVRKLMNEQYIETTGLNPFKKVP